MSVRRVEGWEIRSRLVGLERYQRSESIYPKLANALRGIHAQDWWGLSVDELIDTTASCEGPADLSPLEI